MVSNAGADSEEEEEGEEAESQPDAVAVTTEPARTTHLQAANAIDILMRYFEQSALATADDMQPLSIIRCRVDNMRLSAQKQTSISDFFRRS